MCRVVVCWFPIVNGETGSGKRTGFDKLYLLLREEFGEPNSYYLVKGDVFLVFNDKDAEFRENLARFVVEDRLTALDCDLLVA